MTYLYIKNVSSSNIEVKDYFVHSIDSENVEKVIVKNINEEKFNAFQYTQNKNIENTARLYLGTMQSNRKVWEITLTDPDYSVFTGTLSVILKGGFYTNSSHTSIERADYNGDLSFVNGVGTVDVGLFGMSNYGSFIEEHNVPFNTLFYYVIDSTHTTWTDDLSAWGYSLISPVVLPTVTPYRNAIQYTGTQINAGTSQFLVNGNNKISYDTSVIYGFRQWVMMTTVQRTPGEIINDAGFVAVKNTGSSAITGVYNVDYATCSSNQSELVTVYDPSNVAYNSFRFTASGTDYYYVLDGTQTDWTDDLSSIGYHLHVVLPTVTKLDTLYNTWGTVNAGQVQTLRTTSSASGPTLDYDSSLIYAVWYYRPSGSAVYGDLSKVSIVSNSGYVAITATEYVQAYYVGVYTCNSLNVSIIIVYDSSNVAYNAFKFTSSSTDYYYVLDGTQTDWTDDLSSIGYHQTYIEVLLGLKWQNSEFISVNFDYSSGNYWWGYLADETDEAMLTDFGISVARDNGRLCVYYSSSYTWELIEMYSDDTGQSPITCDTSLYYFTASPGGWLQIWCTARDATYRKTYKVRITKRT